MAAGELRVARRRWGAARPRGLRRGGLRLGWGRNGRRGRGGERWRIDERFGGGRQRMYGVRRGIGTWRSELHRASAVVRAGGQAADGNGFQCGAERVGGLEAAAGILGHAHQDDLVERRREIAAERDRRRRIGVELRGHQRVLRIGVEWDLAGEHFVERGAEGVDVGAGVGGFAADLLGRHVVERAEGGAGGGERAFLVGTGDAEVHEFQRRRRR